jgi:hypothetical protein
VEVHADYDARGMLGVGDTAPGYSEVRCVVRIESDASEEAIERLLDEAEAHSSYIDVFRRPIPVRRELRVSAPRR